MSENAAAEQEAFLVARVEEVTARWNEWREVVSELEILVAKAEGVMSKFEQNLYEAQDALSAYLARNADPGPEGEGIYAPYGLRTLSGVDLTYITFGAQYKRDAGPDDSAHPHPLAPWADARGYLTVVTPRGVDSRPYVNDLLEQQFAFDYATPPSEDPWYPLGELAHLVVYPDGSTCLTVHPWGEDAEADTVLLGEPDVGL